MANEKIQWLNWTKDTFEIAKHQKKPILLSITAVWCHWCHRMQSDSWENPKIVKIINERFVPIRVDTDKRPDINERYNVGGWPTTAILDADGKLVFGGTYIPPEQLRPLLEKVAEDYTEGKIKVTESYFEKHSKIVAMPSKKVEITKGVSGEVLDAIVSRFDFEFGGFGEPKFPVPAALEMILMEYAKDKDKRFHNIAKIWLDGMLGIMDRYEGGFFRYSVTRDWKEPHYEKMLDVNAGMLNNYAEGYALLGDKKYKDVAEGIARFLLSRLANQESGGFYGSQDADGEEKYYGKSLEERAKLPTPYIDQSIYADWNGRAVSAFLRACRILKDEKLRDFALKTLDFMMRAMFYGGKVYHYFDGNTHLDGLLSDQVHVMQALLDAYELTAKKEYLDRAQAMAEWIIDALLDKNAGGFFDRAAGKDDVGALVIRTKPFFENCAAADALVRLFLQTDEEKYASIAQSCLVAFADKYQQYGHMAAPYALAAKRYLQPLHITVVGQSESKNTKDLLDAAFSISRPKTITFVEPVRDKALLKAKNLPWEYKAYAQVCIGSLCKGFAQDVEKMLGFAEPPKKKD